MIKLQQVIHFTDTNSIEATWVDEHGAVIRCHSYADVQMDMLRADLGVDTAQHSDLIAKVEAGIKPQPPAPLPVLTASKYKFRLALNRLGLFDKVEEAVAASTDRELKLAWLYADEYRSDDPLVLKLGAALGKTEAEIRAVFERANTL